MNYLSPYHAQIAEVCKKYNVRQLFAFGSVLTNRFTDQSDIDLIVNFNNREIKDHFLHFFDFKYSLEDILGRNVDLMEEQPIKNSYLRKNIENTKVKIYG